MRGLVPLLLTLCAVLLAGLALVRQRHRSELLSLFGNKDLEKVYDEDVAKGERIIARMDGKVVNPMWKALTRDVNMRKVLAAALGAQKSGAGKGGSTLGSLFLSSKAHAQGRENRGRVNHPRRPAAARVERGLEEGISVDHMHSNSQTQISRELRAKNLIGLHQLTQAPVHKHSAPTFSYDGLFAPGVLSDDPSDEHETPLSRSGIVVRNLHIKQRGRKAALHGKVLMDGLKKATGFEDEFHPTDTTIMRLKRKVKELKEANKQETVQAKESEKVVRNDAVGAIQRAIDTTNEAYRDGDAGSGAPRDAKTRMKVFMRKLREGGDVDQEVLGLLRNANVLKTIGDQIKEGGQFGEDGGAGVDRTGMGKPIGWVGHQGRERRVKALKEKYHERETIMKEKEERETKELQDSISEENNIVFGNKHIVPYHDTKSHARAPDSYTNEAASILGKGGDGKKQDSADVRDAAHTHDANILQGGDEHAVQEERKDIQFRDDVVPAASASGEGGAGMDDGRGPGEADRVRALGFTNSEQYERHKMESALQHEREEVETLKREKEDERGGLRADVDRDLERGLFSDQYGGAREHQHPFGRESDLEGKGKGLESAFAAGVEAEHRRELVNRVQRDVIAMENSMDEQSLQNPGKTTFAMSQGAGKQTADDDTHARGQSDRSDAGGSLISSAIETEMRKDVRKMGDREVPVKGNAINLDII